MLHQIEVSKAMAKVIGLCRPQVVCADPITSQTPIAGALDELIRDGVVENCKFVHVESEFATLSVAISASAAGARAYAATASQGLLTMAEAVYNAADLGLPIVLTLGNHATGAPINLANDHSDAMAMRESGWIQMFAESHQQAADLHIVAFRLAEELCVPTMVCVDSFMLTPTVELVDLPEQSQVDAYLPPHQPMQALDPANSISMAARVGPDAFTEVRYLQYYKQQHALGLIERLSTEFAGLFGRESGGLLRTYQTDDAALVVVAMGSINTTIKDVIDEMRGEGVSIGLVTLTTFRPFPAEALSAALERASNVLVIDRSLDAGMGGPLASNVAMALCELPRGPAIHSAIVGLGGRAVPKESLHGLFRQAATRPWRGVHFLDLNERVIAREIHRRGKARRAGAVAESILRQLEIERAARLSTTLR